jgi:hypothetical protein
MELCFTIHVGPRPHRICIRLDELIEWPPRIPGPDPGPWILVDHEAFAHGDDIRVLTVVDRLAHAASPELRDALLGVVHAASRSVTEALPDGIELHAAQLEREPVGA